MTIQPGAAVYTQGFGTRPENVEVPHYDNRAPAATDVLYPVGKKWVFINNSVWELIGQTTTNGIVSSNWVVSAGGTSQLNTLSGDTGTATPVAGNIQIAGTANQITTAASGSTVTLSLPSAVTFPGSATATTSLAAGTTVTAGTGITSTLGNIVASAGNINATLGSMSAGTTMTAGTGITATTGNIAASSGNLSASGTVTGGTGVTATSGNITATNGNIVLTAAGNKMIRTSVASTTTAGANSIGTVTLVNGTATVSTTAVTANSLIRTWRQAVGSSTAMGFLTAGTIVPGTSFDVFAATQATPGTPLATDLSVVGWEIIN